ncbi:DUF6046 domain-containing protein [Elizabethkingia anophelis]|uniref:DUF6046 domain-containing protein n=1 Tax=Elizabethkingia anophelis TaxID=1117645 RepID=UPI00389141AE
MVTIFDLNNLYKEYFGKSPFYVGAQGEVTQNINSLNIPKNETPRGMIHYNKNNINFNKIGKYGQDIWFPVELRGQKGTGVDLEIINIVLDACTTAVNLTKTVIRTAVSERKGTVKEMVNVDDYKFTVRGFLIGKNRRVPEGGIQTLKELFESTKPVTMHGGYPEMFLDETCQVVISTLEFPETQGTQHWIRPFIMTIESDFINDLEFNKK